MRIALCLTSLLLVSCSVSQPTSAVHGLSPEREAAVLGVYAQRQVFAKISELPIVGKRRTVASSDRLVELVKAGEGYQLRERSCRLRVVSDGPLKISFSDQSIQALAPLVSTVTLDESEGVLTIHRPLQTEIMGAQLKDPKEDLPLKDSDPRLVDVDHDGKPGLTAAAEAGPLKGQLYIVQRSVSRYAAREEAPGVFAGRLEDETEQAVVGTSNFLLNAAKGKIALTADPDPDQSRVQLIKVESATTCADLDGIFGS